jgi:hypothetical protein
MGDGAFFHPGQLFQKPAQTGEAVDPQTGQSQAGMGGVKFIVGFFNDKTFHDNSPAK